MSRAIEVFKNLRPHWNEQGRDLRLKELELGHPQTSAGLWWWSPAKDLPALNTVRDGSGNSIVSTSLSVLTDGFTEAPPVVTAEDPDGQTETLRGHPVTELLENPNPFMTADLLWDYYIWSTRVDGNAYLFKQRSPGGRVIELWPLRPDLTEPVTPTHSDGFIDFFRYTPDSREVLIPREDIVHLRLGTDPKNHRLGRAPLKAVLNEVVADEAAAQFGTALLTNMAIPGVIIGPKAGEAFDGSEGVEQLWKDKFGGGRRGEPLVLDAPTDIKVVSFSPEQMNFEILRRVPEERITAALRVPAILAGMGAGIAESSGKSEGVALISLFTEKTLIPDWRRVAAMLTNQLLRDFDDNPTHKIEFDISEVRSLQEDQNQVWDRADKAVRSGWLAVSEAKRMVGLTPNPTDDVYLRTVAVEEVPITEGMRTAPSDNGQRRVSELA